MIKYASYFFNFMPIETVQHLRDEFKSLINVDHILPALIGVKDNPINKQMVINYLKPFIANSTEFPSQSMHSLYIYKLATGNDVVYEDTLDQYLTKAEKNVRNNVPIFIDRIFALRLFERLKKKYATMKIYAMMEFYEKAVEIALDLKNYEAAKEYANYAVEHDYNKEMCKRIWLKIAEALIPNLDKDNTVKLFKESKGYLSINDILQLSAPSLKIKDFQLELKSQFSQLNENIDTCKESIKDYVSKAEKRHELISENLHTAIIIHGTSLCEFCKEPLIGSDKFMIFPCKHSFHRVYFLWYNV